MFCWYWFPIAAQTKHKKLVEYKSQIIILQFLKSDSDMDLIRLKSKTLGNELFDETHMLTKQKALLGRRDWVECSRVREPRRTAL